MASYSKTSQQRLATCHPDLRDIFHAVIEHYDCTIITGHRTQEKQDEAFHEGRSKVQWPNSKHNSMPSTGIDAAPYPIDWNDTRRFDHFAGYVQATATRLGYRVRWGGDWDSDRDFKDQTFNDLVHFELA